MLVMIINDVKMARKQRKQSFLRFKMKNLVCYYINSSNSTLRYAWKSVVLTTLGK